MPVYAEMVKDKKTGKMKEKKVDGKKQYYIRTYITDEFGNKKQITRHNKDWLGSKGEKEANWEETRLQNTKFNSYENIVLSDLSENYLEYKKPMIKISTYVKYRDDIYNYIIPYFPNKNIFDINPNDIINWQMKINKLNLSIRTKKTLYTTFSSLLKHGCIFYGLEKNVVTLVDNFKDAKGKSKHKMNFLTESEFQSFIEIENNLLYRNFFTILFYTGMRRGELLALKKDDINFSENTINIDETYTPRYEKYGVSETDPKTNKSNRKIQMLNIVANIFKSMDLDNANRIFKDITLTTLKRKCDNNCKKANINKNIRIHDFRHSFASMCIEKDVPIGIISEYLGHENISITLDTYSHLYPNSQNKLLDKLN